MNDFETWWYHEGSGPPLRGEDSEEHCKRMCQIAWSNGAFKAEAAKQEPEDGDWVEVRARWGRRFVEMPNPLLGGNHIARFYFDPSPPEPFGYFRAEPFGWTDCAETDEGAIPLYQLPKDLT